MTYCLGLKWKGSVFLVADTAATRSHLLSPAPGVTSFGQLQLSIDGAHVEEAILKTVVLAPGFAIAYSGDVRLALAITSLLKGRCDGLEVAEIISDIINSLGPFDDSREVALLLAKTSAGKQPELYLWRSSNPDHIEPGDFFQIGSLGEPYKAITKQLVLSILHENNSPCRVLAIISAFVQSYGMTENLVNHRVAGPVFGLYASAGEIVWQEDTNYLIHNNDFSFVACTYVLVRDNALIARSTINNNTNILANSAATNDIHKWLSKWKEYSQSHILENVNRYWVFLSTESKSIAMIRRENLDRSGTKASFEITSRGPGKLKFELRLSDDLRAAISFACRPDPDRSSIRFVFVNDEGKR